MKPIGLFIGLSVYLFFSVIWVLGDGEVQGPISVRRVPRKIRCTHPYLHNSSMRLSSLPGRVFTVTAFALSTHAYVVRSAPRKIAMWLLLYRVCHKVGSLRAWATVWYRRHDRSAAAASRMKLKCGVPVHKYTDPHAPAHTHTYHSTHSTDTIGNVHTHIVVVHTNLMCECCCIPWLPQSR